AGPDGGAEITEQAVRGALRLDVLELLLAGFAGLLGLVRKLRRLLLGLVQESHEPPPVDVETATAGQVGGTLAAARPAIARRSAIDGANVARRSASTSGSAVSGCPPGNGGSGAYSMLSWISWATRSPERAAAITSAVSIPAVTPPPVMRFPSTTTRPGTAV